MPATTVRSSGARTVSLSSRSDFFTRSAATTSATRSSTAPNCSKLTRLSVAWTWPALALAGAWICLAEPAFEVFFDARQQVILFDDALPALQALSARYPVVALSNGNADVHRIGIGQHFHAAISAAQIGVGKPDRRIFTAAAQAAGVPENAVLHIGDDAHLDGAGALAAGMQLAWINRTAEPWPEAIDGQPHAVAQDMQALCRLLDI